MGLMLEILLNSGGRMPVMGMGTAAYPISPPELVESAVYQAIELGYRHFDTASVYQTEQPLGRAISRALQHGLIQSREQLFITSKLWCTDAYADGVLPALKETLRALGLDYIDLYLIHFPVRLKGEKGFVFSSEDVIPFDMRGTWEAMEECSRLGLAKAIGVSNFTCRKIGQLLTHANIPPAVNQVEMHPFWQQKKLRDFCKEKDIHVSAFSPLGGGENFWGSPALLNSQDIKQIATAKGMSAAQVCLRWALEQGVSVLPKSFNKERLKENLDVLDLKPSEDVLHQFNLLPQGRHFHGEVFINAEGPYKSVTEFWDGEI